MRAHEFINEGKTRKPDISLRHLNRLKHINRARAASDARRLELKRIMYASPAWEHNQIELEKARLELAQQQAELAATKAEAQIKTGEAITDMADAGSKANQQSRNKVASMARPTIRKRKTDRQSDRRI